MPETTIRPKRSRLLAFRLIAFSIGFLLVFALGELAFRLFPQWVADPPAPAPYNYRILNDTYGWLAQEGYHWQGEMRDHAGTPYPVTVNFGSLGFRCWGDTSATRKKVLFVGDSYVASAQTSDDRLFYKLLADSLGIEAFAYGAAGYGSIQEVLLVERYISLIRPDLVVWEFCSNDFMDNYWPLEETAVTYHVRMPRPYILEDGRIVHRLAAEYPRNVKRWSHFLYFILRRIAQARGTFDKAGPLSSDRMIVEQGLDYAPFARSVRMTDAAIKKMRAVLPPGTRLLAFSADHHPPQTDEIERLCRDNQVEFAAGLPDFIKETERSSGACVHTDDGYHWNDRGHDLVATFLRPAIAAMLASPQ